MQATLDLANELNCELANFYSAMAYPGSPLYNMAVQNNWVLPSSWSGFSQHSFDCLPLPIEKVSAAQVLKFLYSAFHQYFTRKRYLDTVTQKFGWETRQHIDQMIRHKLHRKIVEDMEMSGAQAAA
jgi:anaerobic magnesium-protoporphyrin IX monomethyl ester cyclase